MYWHKFDKRSDRIDQKAMPIGSLQIRAWRMRNGRWRLFVVRVDPWTGWSDKWWPVEDSIGKPFGDSIGNKNEAKGWD